MKDEWKNKFSASVAVFENDCSGTIFNPAY